MPSSLPIDETYPREAVRTVVHQIDLCRGMGDAEGDANPEAMSVLRPDKGAIIAHDGDPSDSMYLVTEGGVRVLPPALRSTLPG